MTRIQQRNSNVTHTGNDPVVAKGLKRDTPVAVPLDVLAELASVSKRHLERRPPKLKLRKGKERPSALGDTRPIQDILPLISKDTADTALEIAELVSRRQEQVMQSGTSGAKAGLASLERMMRMFEHVYMLDTGMNIVRVKP